MVKPVMPRQKPQIWLCRSCVGFLSRREAEALAAAHDVPARTAERVHCNAIGAFVSDTTSEGRAMIDDLTFDAYAAGLRQAGYEVVLFSACCTSN
jgi:hypothetical protein